MIDRNTRSRAVIELFSIVLFPMWGLLTRLDDVKRHKRHMVLLREIQRDNK